MHSAVDAHLDSFHFLANMNSATMNICIQVFVWTNVFILGRYIPRSDTLFLKSLLMVEYYLVKVEAQLKISFSLQKGIDPVIVKHIFNEIC